MDLWIPISAHAEWIARFRETLYRGVPVSGRGVFEDKACKLGQWFQHHEAALGHLREYQAAKKAHAQFHVRAAFCVRLANAGRKLDALAETDDGGELRRLSRRLVKAFQKLKLKVKQQGLVVTWKVPPRGSLAYSRGAD